jgi:hypothetical protein
VDQRPSPPVSVWQPYVRLEAYSFFGLSKCEVVRNVELARQGRTNGGRRYFQLHIS